MNVSSHSRSCSRHSFPAKTCAARWNRAGTSFSAAGTRVDVRKACHVPVLEMVEQDPVVARELAESALERHGVRLRPVPGDRAREVDGVELPGAGTGRLEPKLVASFQRGHVALLSLQGQRRRVVTSGFVLCPWRTIVCGAHPHVTRRGRGSGACAPPSAGSLAGSLRGRKGSLAAPTAVRGRSSSQCRRPGPLRSPGSRSRDNPAHLLSAPNAAPLEHSLARKWLG